ncbi:MAG: hypothetical protein MZW92_66085 [Comamonadaceae bacterium]|nr:hypothetical protein [Comamonadaceae bacterium]
MRSIVDPLKLGQHGRDAPDRRHALAVRTSRSAMSQDGVVAATLTVRRLRDWIDQPRADGAAGRTAEPGHPGVRRDDQPVASSCAARRTDAEVDSLPDDVELREQALPAQADWQEAVRRASAVFGLVTPQTPECGQCRQADRPR